MIKNTDIMRMTTAGIAGGARRENWLPINRKDQGLDIIMRIYQPDLEKMKTWQAPKAEEIAGS